MQHIVSTIVVIHLFIFIVVC